MGPAPLPFHPLLTENNNGCSMMDIYNVVMKLSISSTIFQC